MNSEAVTYRITNRLLRAALLGISDVLGDQALKRVLKEAHLEDVGLPPDNDEPSITFAQYAALDAAVRRLYAPRGAAVLRNIGNAVFHRSLRDQALILRLLAQSIKAIPERQRIKMLLQQMAKGITDNTIPHQETWVEDDGDVLAFCLRPCGLCTNRQSDEPVGDFLVGSIQAAIRWAVGRNLEVVETHCMARGDDHGRVEVRLKKPGS